MRSQLFICTFLATDPLAQSLQQYLSGDRYVLTQHQSPEAFLRFVERGKQQLDCLVLEDVPELQTLIDRLHEQGTLLPSVILKANAVAETYLSKSQVSSENVAVDPERLEAVGFYQRTAVCVSVNQLDKIANYIDQAIAQFLELASEIPLPEKSSLGDNISDRTFLLQQQQRLAEKLRERLGYLGVYYKRNPKYFFRHLPGAEKQEFLKQLKVDYRQIVINYFSQTIDLNQKIDEFVNTAFFSDIPVTHIVEIHMELMDELSKQLKLEGRSDEVLLDYRLTLIDAIAHLCEMYRRSLPRES